MKLILRRYVYAALLLTVYFLDFGHASNVDTKIALAVEKYKMMNPNQLLEEGDRFLNRNVNDSAMICYSLIYNNNRITENDTLQQQIVCKALNRTSTIWFYHCDYKMALEFLLKSLALCEKIGYVKYIGGVYNNIGNVYYQFNDYKSAKKYYLLAHKYGSYDYILGTVLNNLGMLADAEGKADSAIYLYKKACKLKEKAKIHRYNVSLGNIGVAYQTLRNYDSAFIYYRVSLSNAVEFNDKKAKAMTLSNIGRLYLDFGRSDSAMHYINLSNEIADKYRLFNVLSDNYLYLAQIQEKYNNSSLALDYYKRHSNLKDSLFNASKYSTINNMQFMYDMAKIDKQISELNVEQEVKDKTIEMQRRSQFIMALTLMIVLVFLILLYRKNKTLNRAYNVLFIKNMEIVNSDKLNEELRDEYEERIKERDLIIARFKMENKVHKTESDEQTSRAQDIMDCDNMEEISLNIVDSCNPRTVKYKGSSLTDNHRDELVTLILKIMDNRDVFCDVDFTIDRLSKMVGSNPNYVSQIINDTFKKNFRTFINDYRIKEARRILSSPECKKYTIESIGTMVGFKSRRTFDTIFKEITGISPSFYVKSQKSW